MKSNNSKSTSQHSKHKIANVRKPNEVKKADVRKANSKPVYNQTLAQMGIPITAKTSSVSKILNPEVKKPQPCIQQATKEENTLLKVFMFGGGTALMVIITVILLWLATGCSYSINMMHSSGEASDAVEETSDINPTVDPTLTIP